MRAKLGLAAVIGLALVACGGKSSTLPPHQQAGPAQPAGHGVRTPRMIQAYSAAVLADSPIVYYPLNESSGATTASDTSGHGYNGTYGSSVTVGNASLVGGDQAPTFPGGTSSSSTVVSSSTNSALAPTGSFSVEFWVNVPSTVSGSQFLWTQTYQSGSSAYPAYISLESGSPAFFEVQINTTGGLVAAYPAVVLGAKNHLVVTWNGSTLSAYVNGSLADSATGSGTLTNYASPYAGFKLGGPVPGHTGFSGALGEFALYGSALSSTRVSAHYNAAINADPTPAPTNYSTQVQSDNPVVYYRTNEPSGTTAVDSSSHGYNGTYGSSVTLGGTGLVAGDTAPTFPGGTASSSTVLQSSTNSALAPTGSFSVEFWVNVPSSVTTSSQFLWAQTYASGASYYPAYISLESGSPPFFEVQINTTNGVVATYPAAVLGAKNHVVVTWNGTTLTAYVNGTSAGTATGSGSITNYSSPYAGFTFGGPGAGHPGFSGALGEFALYNTALSSSRVLAHYNAGSGASGTIVWQTGNGTLGDYVLPSTSDGQCSGVGPTISGNNASFTLTRNTSGTYNYDGVHTYSGASTCYRNQLNPVDHSTGTNWLFTLGQKYTFTFQTVVTMNGNTAFVDGLSGGHLAVDVPGLIWQAHSYGGDGGACTGLVIGNTHRAYESGITQYGTVSSPGSAVWNFHGCDDNPTPTAQYYSADTIYDGEIDNWQIDVTAQIQGRSGGSIVVRRNGSVVYNTPNHVCDSSTTDCFWNFGPYMFYWENSEEPSGWNNAGVTVKFNNMTLIQH